MVQQLHQEATSFRMDNDDEIQLELQPLDIDLVLEKVLNYVGGRYLLDLRLVNHFWNSRISKILRPNYEILLDHLNIQEYLDLLSPLSVRQSQEFLAEQAVGQLNFKILFKNIEIGNPIDDLVKGAVQLTKLFGPKCVKTVICHSWCPEYTDWGGFIEFLLLVSPGLEILYFGDHVVTTPLQLITLNTITFPELKRFFYMDWTASHRLDVINSIIKSSSKLEHLRIKKDPALIIRHVDQNGINHIVNRLRKLEITDSILLSLKHFHFEQLTVLKIYFDQTMYHHWAGFAQNHCLQLQTLDLHFTHESTPTETPLWSFPSLPKLTHFGYHISYPGGEFNTPSFIMIDNLTALTIDKVPALESISTSLGTCLIKSANIQLVFGIHDQAEEHINPFQFNDVVLPTVTTLHFTVLDCADVNFEYCSGMNISVVEHVSYLHGMYPNIRKLVVNFAQRSNIYSHQYQRQRVHQKLVFIALLNEVVGIEELEIKNYYEQWLEESLPECAAKIQGLKLLRISPLSKSTVRRKNLKYVHYDDEDLNITPVTPVCVNTILQYIPNLRVLQISVQFLKAELAETCEHVQFRLEEFRVKFPNLTIVLL